MGLGCDEQVDQERQIFPALYFDGFFPAFDLRLAKESDAQILHMFIIHAGEARASLANCITENVTMRSIVASGKMLLTDRRKRQSEEQHDEPEKQERVVRSCAATIPESQ